MKNRLKKMLSVLLAAAVIMSLCVTTVFAEPSEAAATAGTEDMTDADAKQVIEEIITAEAQEDNEIETASEENAIGNKVHAESIVFDQEEYAVDVNGTVQIGYTLLPEDCTDTIRWRSLNPSVASVDENGCVTGVSEGTAWIIAHPYGLVFDYCKVTVTQRVESIELSQTEASLKVGDELALEVYFYPEGTSEELTWSSSDETVAQVDQNGLVTALAPGTALICVETEYLGASCTVTVGLEKPVLLSATNDNGQITLKWERSAGATGYEIYRSLQSNKGFSLVKTIKKGGTTSWTDTSCELGTTYYYKIKAYNADTISRASSVKKAKAQINAPKLKKTVESTGNTIKISWNKNAKASGYFVYRKSGDGKWKRIADITSNKTTSYKDKNVSGVYSYKVAAYLKQGTKKQTGKKSGAITARTLKAVSYVWAQQYNNEFKAEVSWEKVNGATGYTVLVRNNKDLTSEPCIEENVTTNYYICPQEHGKTYTYVVLPYYENDGTVTKNSNYADFAQLTLRHEPDFKCILSAFSKSETDTVSMLVINSTDCKIRIKDTNAYLYDDEDAQYNRALTLVDGETQEEVSYVDIPANSSAKITFKTADEATRYNMRTRIYYEFKCDGAKYYAISSFRYGTEWNIK